MKSKLEVWEDVTPNGRLSNKFRIVETYQCSDGYRSRITNRSFISLENALEYIKEYNGD